MNFDDFKTEFERVSIAQFSELFWPLVDAKRAETVDTEAEFDVDDFTDEEGGTMLKANMAAAEIVESSASEADLIGKIASIGSIDVVHCIANPTGQILGHDSKCTILAACADRMNQIS